MWTTNPGWFEAHITQTEAYIPVRSVFVRQEFQIEEKR